MEKYPRNYSGSRDYYDCCARQKDLVISAEGLIFCKIFITLKEL